MMIGITPLIYEEHKPDQVRRKIYQRYHHMAMPETLRCVLLQSWVKERTVMLRLVNLVNDLPSLRGRYVLRKI